MQHMTKCGQLSAHSRTLGIWSMSRSCPLPGVIQKVFAVKGYREMECWCVQKYLCSDILKRDVGHRSTEEALRAYRTGQAGEKNLFDMLLPRWNFVSPEHYCGNPAIRRHPCTGCERWLFKIWQVTCVIRPLGWMLNELFGEKFGDGFYYSKDI